ncbi:helix-turn-helix transcriptional regulator [Adlercreutzia aquisgranensis]|uniref:helix-turn-helix transcriptional regulator n=1 Tax=Adlercreutzia aquisgranensis TaxID=2941323 RepID=UPI00203A8F33|nr:helix-turn-helix transcriptional regulator [Adlercreutzia aquisgranensis]
MHRAGFAVAVTGFALFFAWQSASFSFLFPSSAGLAVSPLCVGDLSACFLLVLCLVSYRKDRSAFSPAWMLGLGVLAVVAATVAIVLLSRSLLPLWGNYLAAGVVGFAAAGLAYIWATVLARMNARHALWCVSAGAFGGTVIDLLLMNGLELGIPVLVSLCGAGSLACFAMGTRNRPLDQSPVLIRPKHPREFWKLAVGVGLFAVALGIVAGTTANDCTEDSMRIINESVTLAGMGATAVIMAVLAAGRSHVDTFSLLRGFAAALLAVILLNIVWLDLASVWLSLTLFAWQLLKLFAMLVLAGVQRRGIISLSIAFPAAWAVLKVGHGLGVFAGQTLIPLGGAGLQPLMNSVVLVAFLVAVAAILLLSSRVVMDAAATWASSSGDSSTARSSVNADGAKDVAGADLPDGSLAGDAASANGAGSASSMHPPTSAQLVDGPRPPVNSPLPADSPLQASAQPPVSPLDQRCQQLSDRYKLSAREAEVFRYLAQGHTRASIAKRLFVSENTVREHVKSIYKKLHIHSKQQLIDMVDADREAEASSNAPTRSSLL